MRFKNLRNRPRSSRVEDFTYDIDVRIGDLMPGRPRCGQGSIYMRIRVPITRERVTPTRSLWYPHFYTRLIHEHLLLLSPLSSSFFFFLLIIIIFFFFLPSLIRSTFLSVTRETMMKSKPRSGRSILTNVARWIYVAVYQASDENVSPHE